ncbi:zf-HC2 domain-containing protein [Cellulomonas sp. ACRRI]|uniref:zf-HC2 domain-containing protein n=1 Tax=Cellulomonas sp. ACRRI TaxID=2918188 RepID=UPI001EF26FFC|nr:zf-HC2 domain-containing protein [Cellulomonas sp. ACRRI]MCG7285292.1 zf-HC2 domain-containing protein [Cellulomonas sp. ACRRI]
MSAHLGDRVSALVDGQLAPAAAERALAHVAGCARCAADLAAARAARRVLSGCDDVRPAGDLTARLLALGGAPVPPGADAAARPGDARPMDPFVPPSAVRGAAAFTGAPSSAAAGIGGLLGGRGPFGEGVLGGRSVLGAHSVLGGSVLGSRRLLGDRPVVGSAPATTAPGATRRGLRAAVGSITGLGVVAVGLFLLGDRPTVAPVSESTEALSLLGDAGPAALPVIAAGSEGAAPAAGATTQDYLDWMRAEGWTCPEQVPAGWAVTAVHLRDDGGTLEVDLSGPTGDVVVTEQHGRLDVSALTAAEPIDVEGRTVYLLSAEPWHAAWQSGDTVVEVVSSRTGPGAAAVVAQFPEGEFDAGLSARLTRGWDTFATAVHLP